MSAAVTGETRGFFLLPTLIPFIVIAVCVATLLARRPLTGVLLNRVVGGPADWPAVPALNRVYVWSTVAAIAINVVNAVVQVTFYLLDQPAVLAAMHVATGPIFATLAAVTLAAARRAVVTERDRPDPRIATPQPQQT